MHAQLPLRVSAPFPGELAGLTPVCRSPPGIWLEGTCCVLFLRACGVRLLGLQVGFPCCLSLTLGWVCFWPKVSQVFVGCDGRLSCPSWFVIFFLCLLVLHLFWGWGGLVTGRWPLLRLLVLDSSDARLHRPDALASVCYATPISGRWMVLAPALSWALPWVLPSRFQCWLLA